MDVLRAHGAVVYDAAGYVFRLLVLKFLSDVTDGHPTSGVPQFVVPPLAHWSQLRGHSPSGLGDRVNQACAVLEKANPSLNRLLTEADFNSIRLGDRVLVALIQTLSALPHLSGELVSDGSLGEVADDFLHRLAEASGRGYGEFYTPPSVARLLAELLDPQEGMRLYDPVCGVGGFLVECTRRVASKSAMSLSRAAATLVLHGQEKNAERWALCRMNLLLHGIVDARIEHGNALWSPLITEQGRLLEYDRILADPPWNLDNWGAELAANDAFGRFTPLPPRHNANYAFVQHCLAALAEGGRVTILMPRGALFRGGVEEQIRRKLLEEDRFEAIIGLPGNLLYDISIAPIILVLRKGKPADRRNHVLFIDASEAGVKKSRRRVLLQEDISAIVKAFQDFGDNGRHSRAVHLDEIAKLNWNLTVEQYVERAEERERLMLGEQLDALADAEKQRDEAARRMDAAVSRLQRFCPSAF
ncbi:N-6 DNA methylase [Pyxidicoccus sp. 3LFB2]